MDGCTNNRNKIKVVEGKKPRYINLSSNVFHSDSEKYFLNGYDTSLNCNVSIQRICHPLPLQTLAQVELLRHLEHENVVSILNLILSSEAGPYYIVCECFETTLEQVINSDQLTLSHASLFTYQTLRGLKYLHSASIVHRCLSPSNILVNCTSLILKLSGMWDNKASSDFTYSAPEDLMGIVDYNFSQSLDIWSTGCILVEMTSDRNIFHGQDKQEVIMKIMEVVPMSEFDCLKVFKFLPQRLLKDLPLRPRCPITACFFGFDENLVNLLDRMLRFDARHRIGVEEALRNPFFSDYHCYEDEPTVDPEVMFMLQRALGEDGEWIKTRNGEVSLEEMVAMEMENYMELNFGKTLQKSSTFQTHNTSSSSSSSSPSPLSHSITIPEKLNSNNDHSLSSSSSSSIHSVSRYSFKELRSKLRQKYGCDSDKEQAEGSEEKGKEDEEMEVLIDAIGNINCTPINRIYSLNSFIAHLYQHDNKLEEKHHSIENNEECEAFKEQTQQEQQLSDKKSKVLNFKEFSITEGEVGDEDNENEEENDNGGEETGVSSLKSQFNHETKLQQDDLFKLPTDHLKLNHQSIKRYADDMNDCFYGNSMMPEMRGLRIYEGTACGGYDHGSLDDLYGWQMRGGDSLTAFDWSPSHSNRYNFLDLFKTSRQSSPESSPPSLYTGARPKKSSKNSFRD